MPLKIPFWLHLLNSINIFISEYLLSGSMLSSGVKSGEQAQENLCLYEAKKDRDVEGRKVNFIGKTVYCPE